MMSETIDSISDAGAKFFIQQSVELGYFHRQGHPRTQKIEDDKIQAFRKLQKDPPQKFTFGANCEIICSRKSTYYTREGMIKEIVEVLNKHGGRKSLPVLCEELEVEEKILQANLHKLPLSVQVVYSSNEIISETYWQQLREIVEIQVRQLGRLQVLKMANQHSVPMELFVTKVVSKIPQTRLIRDSKVLVSYDYMSSQQKDAVECFRSLAEPALISKICESNEWDNMLVLDWLKTEIENGNIPGEVHIEAKSKNTLTAIFLPKIYNDKQKEEAMQFLSNNGFISEKRATQHGLPLSKIAGLAGDSSGNVILVGDLVIVEHVALQKIQLLVQVCVESGIIDVQEYLPTEFIRSDILIDLLRRANFTSEQVEVVMVEGQAILVSEELIKEISNKILTPIIQKFAKTRAAELFKSSSSVDEEGDYNIAQFQNGRKGKPKVRKAKSKRAPRKSEIAVGVVSLFEVVKAIINGYPNTPLTEIGQEDLRDSADWYTWEDEKESDILLIQFCKKILYTSELRKMCDSSTLAELRRLRSSKQSKATVSRRDEAAKVRSVDAAFEDSFVTLCYMIQANAKFVALAEASKSFDEASLNILKIEMLQSCCANITSRITQYCLFKNEEESIFTFNNPEGTKSESRITNFGLPSFCSDIDITTLRYKNNNYLSCPPPREPLPVLRESLPGNMGVSLARQWVFCGGECYRGGIRIAEDDGSAYTRPGSIDNFMTHIQENSLTLCGLPFKKLDKKSEKLFLFKRRQALTELLKKAIDPTVILELTIAILFQQVKQIVVSGNLLRSEIMKMLFEERKISKAVQNTLQNLNTAIQVGISINQTNENLVKKVKECGLCRDISKHEV